MPKDTTTADSNANKVFDLPVSLKAGEVNTLSFPQDSIKSMHLTPDNHLEVSFRDGSKIEIENFQELVNSAQSCGRDTIIQLSDNTIIYPEELNTQLAQGPVTFNGGQMASGEATDGVFDVSMPRAGQVIERDVSEGAQYKLGFNIGEAISAAQAGNNLILTFADGGVLVLKNYFPATASSDPAQFSFANGNEVNTAALLSSCKLVEVASVAEGVAAGAPMIEPAAGEEVAEKEPKIAAKAAKQHVPDVEPAAGEEKVVQKGPQDIEPAAGDSGAQLISSNRGGYGFASSLQDAAFATSNPIGPIGPTALGYERPDFPVGQIRGTPTLASIPSGPLPGIGPSSSGVDETNFTTNAGRTTGGALSSTNGPVTFAFNDGFGISGSVAGGRLTSNGEAVVVTRNGNTFTGSTPGGATVFTIVLNNDGTYTYTQSRPLDHANAQNPDDIMTLTFGVTGTNSNGASTSFVSIFVRDDGPVAQNDGNTVGSNPLTVSGNVLTNDNAGQDGHATLVSFTFEGVTKTFTNGQPVTFDTTRGTLVVNQDGSYTYTSHNANLGTDVFNYVMRDYDGDTATANLSIAVTDIDTTPIFLGSAMQTVDDTNLGPNVVNGNVPFDFRADGPGTITGNGNFNSTGDKLAGQLTSNGVPIAVAFDAATNTWTGTANGATVFTMVVHADGTYTFTQNAALDHSDPNTQNDAIDLVFGVTGTDTDGDTATGTVTIRVLDDAPTAVNDTGVVNPATNTATGNLMANDDLSNDGVDRVIAIKFGNQTVAVPAVGDATITGTYGVLTVRSDGTYTYVANNGATGHDQFTYTIRDFDGDTSSANVDFNVADTIPTISGSTQTIDETNFGVNGASVNGTYAYSYGADGPGSITHSFVGAEGNVAGGSLSSGGFPVSVVKNGNVYTGTANGVTVFTMTINTDGTYSYSQVRPFDHSDTNNTNEGLALRFRLDITDSDGDHDQTPGNNDIVINVLDDAPVAVNDGNSVTTPGGTVNGNVMNNDVLSKDAPTTVVQVKFGNQTVDVPAAGTTTINGAHGVLTIAANGTYSYVANPASGGTDTFTYVIRDRDGDTSPANLSIATTRFDDVPTISGGTTTIDETTYTFGTAVNGTYAYNYGADGAGSISHAYVGAEGSVPNGGLRSGGVPVTVAQTGNTYIGTANGVEVFRVVINSNGTYTYTQSRPLDHADGTNPNDQLALRFRLDITDSDGDHDQTPGNNDIVINVLDDGPSIGNGYSTSDDDLVGTPGAVVNGSMTNINFGQDGAGRVVGNGACQVYKADGTPLTLHSGGLPVLVTFDAATNTYTGTTTAGATAFSLVVHADGTYTFTQNAPFDHQTPQDTDDANFYLDYIDLSFGATIIDGDNDSANACINIRVSDSGPDARDDGNTVTTPGSTVTGNVMTNDIVSHDSPTTVYWIKFGNNAVQVPTVGEATIQGAYGVLTIRANGTYSYAADPSKSGTDVFSYTLVDRDGDYDHANLSISTTRFDDVPSITGNYSVIDETNFGVNGASVNGTYAYSYGADGPGSITHSFVGAEGNVAGGSLSSGGFPVSVVKNGNVYTGTANGVTVFTMTINTDGTYSYSQVRPFDHSDTNNTNEGLALRFRLDITDSDGDHDQTPGNNDIVINVLDDAPVAVNDGNSVTTPGGTVNGNVMNNDVLSKDAPTTVVQVKFGNQTVDVPAAGTTTINGAHGVLTIAANGTYSYVANPASGGTDTFTYVIRDRDGDTSPANLSIATTRFDDVPTISGGTTTIDETTYTFGTAVNGTYAYNYGADGAGSISHAYVGAEGSVPNGGLRSGGVPVTVAQTGNTYIGTANGVEVFRVVINSNGTYTYTQSRPLDHADGTNPNDQLALRFRLDITDSDGDHDQTPGNNDIVINVLDDAPVAVNDGSFSVGSGATYVGLTSLLANDTLSRDGGNTVTQIKFGNQTITVPTTGSIDVTGAYGVLTVRADGTYSYHAGTNAGGTDTFTYVVRDADGDTSQANVTFNAAAPTPFGVVVEAHNTCGYEDSCAVLDFKATRTGGDGDEVITVRVEGIPAGWRIEYPAGNFVASTGAAWTYTLAAGQNFVSDPNLGGVKLWPPANSDADLSGLHITATIYDPDTNSTANSNLALSDVVIDAVVDVPDVSATVGHVTNGQASVNITTHLGDTDGSESITVVRLMAVDSNGNLVGLPYGITFNHGHAVGGEWHLTTAELAGLKMNVPTWFNQDFRLGVMAVAEETSAGHGTNREFDYTNNATYDLYVVDHAVQQSGTSSNLTVTSSATAGDATATGSVVINGNDPTVTSHATDGSTTTTVNVSNFNAAEGDTLDISSVIAVDSATDHAINDFVYAHSDAAGKISVQDVVINITAPGVENVHVQDLITMAQINQNSNQV